MILLLIIFSILGYLAAYHLYGKFIAQKIFQLSDKNKVPSQTINDKKDYVPSPKWVVMGHHFTSIAGTGPIVGPAIGIIWGWVPAVLWVFLGSIFMGAVHDFFALVLSVRQEGKSISEVAATYIHPLARLLFMAVIFFLLLLLIAIFGMVIAIIFDNFPKAVFPVFAEIGISFLFFFLQRRFPQKLLINTGLCLTLMLCTLFIGHHFPIHFDSWLGLPATGAWTLILLTYAFVASTLPVQWLLQPRDYLNAWKLYIILGLILVSILILSLNPDFVFVAPAFNPNQAKLPPVWPFLFITIACGAISGFHNIVSSGTSAKQIEKESDTTFVGFGSMLVEGFLALLVLIAVGAGIGLGYLQNDVLLTGQSAWLSHYGSWEASTGLSSKITAVVVGFANILNTIGIQKELGIIIIGVFVASFAGTSLDTATRLQRYIVDEFSMQFLKKKSPILISTGIAVGSAAGLAFLFGSSGKGALLLWPLFGSSNQLIAVLGLLLFTVYVFKKNKKLIGIVLIPLLILGAVVFSAIVLQIQYFYLSQNYLLVSILIILMLIFISSIYLSISKIFLNKTNKV